MKFLCGFRPEEKVLMMFAAWIPCSALSRSLYRPRQHYPTNVLFNYFISFHCMPYRYSVTCKSTLKKGYCNSKSSNQTLLPRNQLFFHCVKIFEWMSKSNGRKIKSNYLTKKSFLLFSVCLPISANWWKMDEEWKVENRAAKQKWSGK